MTDREILERLLVSLSTCENQGDVIEVVFRAASLANIELELDAEDEIVWDDDAPGLWG